LLAGPDSFNELRKKMGTDERTYWEDELTPAEILDVELEGYEQYLEGARKLLAAKHADLGEAIAEFAEVVAAVMFGCRESFRPDGWPAWLQTADFAERERQEWRENPGEPTFAKYVGRLVETRFAKELIRNVLPGSFRRFAQLATLLGPSTTSRWTEDFIKHVGRCYVHGMNAECVIMCRSVLDAEFHAEISNDDCIEVLGRSVSGSFTLSDRIRVAERLGRLPFETAEQARAVCKDANEAVHRHPGRAEREDPFEHILKAVSVLRALHGDDASDDGDGDGDEGNQ
jgi:hypothetical protein